MYTFQSANEGTVAVGSSCFLTLNTVSVLDALFIVHRSITLSLLLFYPVNYTMEQDLTTFRRWMCSGRGVAPTGGTYLQYRATWHAHVLCFQWNATYLQCNVMQANFDCIKWLRNYLNTSDFNSFV